MKEAELITSALSEGLPEGWKLETWFSGVDTGFLTGGVMRLRVPDLPYSLPVDDVLSIVRDNQLVAITERESFSISIGLTAFQRRSAYEVLSEAASCLIKTADRELVTYVVGRERFVEDACEGALQMMVTGVRP